jgi:carboxyl-terminal processing protease
MGKWLRLMAGAAIALLFAVIFFTGGVATGASVPALQSAVQSVLPQPEASPSPAPLATDGSPQALRQLFAPFWESWKIIHEEFVDQPVDDDSLMRGAIRGMLEATGDQHTTYMDPNEYEQATIELEGRYEGIGAWVDPDGEYLVIVSPMPDSPAKKAGLLPGDVVVAVDGEDMTGVDGSLVIRRIMGPAGSTVRLTILREGKPDPFEVSLQRASITVPSVEGRLLEDGIGYVQMFTFGEETTDDLRRALREVLAQNPRGLILDLRGNGGGYLSTAIEVASEFIDEGVVLTERFGDGTEQVYRARSGGTATEIPLAILINGGTASASEIVAGAVQDLGRGILVGTQSYGKGSVQNWIPLEDNQGAVRVTVARWYTPSGRLIADAGLEPDVVVDLSEADLQGDRDLQLEAAIEALLATLPASG